MKDFKESFDIKVVFPKSTSLEIPILQELAVAGGSENVRYLYERLAAYFPHFSDSEISFIKANQAKNWKKIVQKTGKTLDRNGLIGRSLGLWTITSKGKLLVKTENEGFTVSENKITALSHSVIQQMLAEIGRSLGFHTQTEFEYYDVVWREDAKNNRISHIFEVQSKGNIDSAFAKLKRAYEAQRTKPFLIISTENDLKRARQSLIREFHDIEDTVTIFTFAQIQQAHQNLIGITEIIRELLLK